MTEKVAIMQPTFIPWLGYFSLIKSVDTFVFLDDVQFNKRSWQQRNRINSQNGEAMISVSVFTKNMNKQLIKDVQIQDVKTFVNKFKSTLKHNYSKAPYYSEVMLSINENHSSVCENLCDFNINYIIGISNRLNTGTKFLRSSSLNTSGSKSEKLLNICKKIGDCQYVSVPGSIEYIKEEAVFSKSPIDVVEFVFNHPKYETIHKPFLEYMSILDVLMNQGFKNTAALLESYAVRPV